MKKVYFKTFGCRTNQFDTQVMMANLKSFQITTSEEEADIIVINSCTVTNGADTSVRNYINQMNRKNSAVKIYLTGCGAYTKGEGLLKDTKVLGVFGHSEKEKVDLLLKTKEPFFKLGDLNHIDSTVVTEFVGKSRAFIKIQEGCDFACSYCIIPSVRGIARSLPEERILSQVQRLASNGFGEFILTGTNVGSYGKDIGSSIAALLKKMSSIRGVRRIRIGSLEPVQITDEFMEILNEPWMARHLHIALQHSSDRMLAIMNRRNRVKEDLELFERIADYGYALGTDFIVGHPGETEEIWSEAIQNIRRFPLTHIHAFTYSKRDKTASALMKEEVPGDVARARHHELTSIIKENNRRFRESMRSILNVLVENQKEGLYSGLDQFFNRMIIHSREDLSGNWIYLENYEINDECNVATI